MTSNNTKKLQKQQSTMEKGFEENNVDVKTNNNLKDMKKYLNIFIGLNIIVIIIFLFFIYMNFFKYNNNNDNTDKDNENDKNDNDSDKNDKNKRGLISKSCHDGYVLTDLGCEKRPWSDFVSCEDEINSCPGSQDPNPWIAEHCKTTCDNISNNKISTNSTNNISTSNIEFVANEIIPSTKKCLNGEVMTDLGCTQKPWYDFISCDEEVKQNACPGMSDPNVWVGEYCKNTCDLILTTSDKYCKINEYVKDNECKTCRLGYTAIPGANRLEKDTECYQSDICEINDNVNTYWNKLATHPLDNETYTCGDRILWVRNHTGKIGNVDYNQYNTLEKARNYVANEISVCKPCNTQYLNGMSRLALISLDSFENNSCIGNDCHKCGDRLIWLKNNRFGRWSTSKYNLVDSDGLAVCNSIQTSLGYFRSYIGEIPIF